MWPFSKPKAAEPAPINSFAGAMRRLDAYDNWLTYPGGVDRNAAAAWPVVWRCVSLISSSMAGMVNDGLMVIDRNRKTVTDRQAIEAMRLLTETPDNGITPSYSFVEDAASDLLLSGNAVFRIRKGPSGKHLLSLCHPVAVNVDVDPKRPGIYTFQVTPDDLDGQTEIKLSLGDIAIARWNRAAGRSALTAGHRGRFMSPPVVSTVAQTILLGLDAEKFVGKFFRGRAGTFASGAMLSDLAVLFDDELSENYTKRLIDALNAYSKHNGRAPLVLGDGAKIQPLDSQAQSERHLDLRKFSVEDGARIWGVPPELLGADGGGRSFGSSISRTFRALIEFCLKAHTSRLLAPLSLRLLPPGQSFAVDWSRASVGDYELLNNLISACRPQSGAGDAVMSREELRSLVGIETPYRSDWMPPKEASGREGAGDGEM